MFDVSPLVYLRSYHRYFLFHLSSHLSVSIFPSLVVFPFSRYSAFDTLKGFKLGYEEKIKAKTNQIQIYLNYELFLTFVLFNS